MIKVGIAGAGFMGEVHASCYSKLPDVQIYAVAEKNPERRQRFVKQFSPKKVYEDAAELASDPEVDLVDVCLPTPLHGPVSVAALRAGKHLLLEKPITLDLKEAEAILEEARRSRGKFMVAHVLRFWPEYTVVRQVLEGGKLGQVREVYAARFNELPLWSEGTWIMDERQSGGLVIDLMIHDIDFLMWNLGKVNRVWAHGIYNEKGFAIQVMAVLEFESGATAYIEGAYLNPSGTGLTTQMRIYGQEGMLEFYPGSDRIRVAQKGGEQELLSPPEEDGYYREIEYFVKCIKENKEPEVITGQEAVESLRVCLAVREALKQGDWVKL